VYAAIGLGGVVVVLLIVVMAMSLRGGGRPEADQDPVVAEAPEPEPVLPSAPPPVTTVSSTLPTTAADDPQAVIQRLKDATVYIKLKINGRLVSTGTGFVIEAQGDTVLLATNKHVAVPDLSELPESIAPKDAKVEIEAVVRSGQGPQVEQALPAKLVGADMSDELDRDLAFLVVQGVRQPPRPLDPLRTQDPTEGMRYTGGGFPLGDIVNRPSGSQGNPSITITGGRVSALRRDDHGRLSIVQLDGSLQPGNSGGPILDERNGSLIGVAVAKAATADTIGFVIPAGQLRRALDGRVGAMILKLASAPSATADLEVRAQIVDPKQRITSVVVHAAPADGAASLRPNPDGSWPPLPNSKAVELTRDPEKAEATGRVQVALNGQGPNPRRVLIQTAHRGTSGQLVYEQPKSVDLPDRPGVIVDGGRFERLIKNLRRRSLSRLGPLVDKDDDCSLKKDETNYSIGITVPGKKVHSISPEMTLRKGVPLHNAPMTLADVSGDFAAFVKVTGDINPGSDKIKGPRNATVPITFQGAGLLLYQDENNFIRLERSVGTEGGLSLVHRLLIEVVRDGRQAMHPIYLDVPEEDLILLIVRRKGRIRCLFSPDERRIIAFEEFAIDFPEKVKVGLSAANISKKTFDATFEEFVIIDDLSTIDEEFGE
jgi:S1-C subfamily serine protease/regulation of enolase protein 1 (concanavalin A-like superfamily)